MPPFVVVTGNIAAGKSLLVKQLATHLGLPAYRERPRDNPFFGPSHQQAFHAEAWFLASAAAASRAIAENGRGGVLERSVEEHVDVFASARHAHGWLSDAELKLLQSFRALATDSLPSPDLLVLLDVDVQVAASRIAQRGRSEEQDLAVAYLRTLELRYAQFADAWDRSPLLRIDTTRVDLRRAPDASRLMSSIKERVE